MSVPYSYLTRNIALRINAVLGTTAAQMETAYATSPLTSTQINSPIFPFSAVEDLVMLAEGRFVNAIANSAHPYRSYLRGLTAALATETAMPTVTSASVPIVGIPGTVCDSSDGIPCRMRPLEEITLRTANAGTYFRMPAYWYAFNGETIYHTRTSVIVEVCKYNQATQRALLAAGNMLLPDDLEGALIDEGLRQAFRDDEFMGQQSAFGQIADAWLAVIAGAGRSVAA